MFPNTAARSRRVITLIAAMSLVAGLSGAQTLTTLASFNGTNGNMPQGRLLARGGYLYGTTNGGATWDWGSIFKVNLTTGELTTVKDFATANENGPPYLGFIEYASQLWGTTVSTIYKLDPDSEQVTRAYTFDWNSGWYVHGPLLARGSVFYGTTEKGGTDNKGRVFRYDTTTNTSTTIASFTGPNGSYPASELVDDGTYLYGTTPHGGAKWAHWTPWDILGDGTIYRLDPENGALTTLFSFDLAAGTGSPVAAPLVVGSTLYGVASSDGGGLLYKFNLTTREFTKVAAFSGPNGSGPNTSLIRAGAYLYGTTRVGGQYGGGTVFRFDPATGALTTLAHFSSSTGTYPSAALLSIGRSLYGTLEAGGAFNRGAVFRLDLATAATTTSLTSSATPAAFGESVTLQSCVTPLPGGGTITFSEGSTALGNVAVAPDGCATLTLSSLLPGAHGLTATYSGYDYFETSTSAAFTQTVDETDTTTTLTSSLNPSRAGYSLLFTATVAPPPVGGTVEFREGANVLGTANVVNGVAKMAAAFAEGSHDIVATYNGNGGFHASTSSTLTQIVGPVSKAKSDLNGDGKADIVLQNSSTNTVAAWMMNGATISSAKNVATPTLDWKVVATGDVDGDGKSDILLKNNATRAVAVWRMDGATMLSGSTIATPATDWRVVTTYDFTGDGKADVILQSASGAIGQWQMNGATLAVGRSLGTPAPELQVITAASFAGTGGLILQNSATGAVERWLVSGSTVASTVTVATPAAGWKVKAADDFTGDGVAEIVVQNDSTGAISIWSLDSSGVLATEHVIATPAIAWKVVGTADYDDDGRADILLRNTSDNRIAIWQTDGTTLLSGKIVATPVAGWTPVLK